MDMLVEDTYIVPCNVVAVIPGSPTLIIVPNVTVITVKTAEHIVAVLEELGESFLFRAGRHINKRCISAYTDTKVILITGEVL